MKFLTSILAVLLFTTSACTHLTKVAPEENFVDRPVPYSPNHRQPANNNIPWWSASEKQVQNAVCRLKLPTTGAGITAFYKNKPLGPGFEGGVYTVSGIEIKDERPELVQQALFDPTLRASTLKFKKVRQEIAAKLQPEMTDWLLKSMEIYSYQMNSSQSNAEYCDIWAEMEDRIYPELYMENKWATKSLVRSRKISPSAGAARGLCLDLVQGFVPTAKSTRTTVTSWLRKNTYLPDDGKINERGITRESLMTHIKDRTRLYEK